MIHQFYHWLHVIHDGGTAAGWVGFLLLIIVNFIPVIPIPMIAAAVGAVFSLGPALLITWSGAALGAILKFLLERLLLQKHALKLLNHFAMTETVLAFLEKNGFAAVLITRLIPVFPSSLVNLAGAVARISISTFVWATLLGKLPVMMTFTFAGNQLRHHFWGSVALIGSYTVIVLIASMKLKNSLKRKKEERKRIDAS